FRRKLTGCGDRTTGPGHYNKLLKIYLPQRIGAHRESD
ncbi:MAG: hypothetical protein ACI9A0_000245, partial [Pseudoalteromonas tetraodonis]